jgi:excisionase family DNA binding protein
MVEERFLTVRETSEFLKISVSTLNRLIKQDEIPSHKLGHRRLFDKDELIRWVSRRRSDGRHSSEYNLSPF